MTPALRVGVDIGAAFTKAVAIEPHPFALHARAVVPTTYDDPLYDGLGAGVAQALTQLLAALASEARAIELVTFTTTHATNALLEGSVPKVGVVGIGRAPDLRAARKRTAVGDVPLAPGRTLRTEHVFLDASGGLAPAVVDTALDRLVAARCEAVAASGAFAGDAPETEWLVAERARERGLPTCAAHELSGACDLELRTIGAAMHASMLPMLEQIALIVQEVLECLAIELPLLVLRGDGGTMSLEAFRRAPSSSIGAGSAAGALAVLHALELTRGIVLDCGGTSSSVSVVDGGRTVLRTLKVMGRPVAGCSVDSWVVGTAGGSMARLRRHAIVGVGPRSTDVTSFSFACRAPAETLDGARLELISPYPCDPGSYAAIRTREFAQYALTVTCAANALGVTPVDSGAWAPQAVALAAFAPLAARLRTSPQEAARALLDAAVATVASAVDEAARAHAFGPEVPVVALGGSGPLLAGEVARVLGRPLLTPEHPEVLSAIGSALWR